MAFLHYSVLARLPAPAPSFYSPPFVSSSSDLSFLPNSVCSACFCRELYNSDNSDNMKETEIRGWTDCRAFSKGMNSPSPLARSPPPPNQLQKKKKRCILCQLDLGRFYRLWWHLEKQNKLKIPADTRWHIRLCSPFLRGWLKNVCLMSMAR